MEETIATFEPISSSGQMVFFLSIILSITGLAGCIWILKKGGDRSNYNRRMLIAMLLFFVFIIGTGTAVFSGLTLRRTGTVTIYESAIATEQRKIPFNEIRSARIIVDKEPSLINPGQSVRTTKLLLIEARDKSSIVLSEADYPVEKILQSLKKARGNNKE